MGYAVVVFGLVAVVGLMAVVVLEGLVLRGLRWGGLGRSLLDSLIMNIFSAAVGILLPLLIEDAGGGLPDIAGALLCLPIAWALSVVVETTALSLIRRMGFRAVARPVVLANLASYVLIGVVILIPALLT
jgi:hypothetical protein